MSSAVCGNESCWHSDLRPLRHTYSYSYSVWKHADTRSLANRRLHLLPPPHFNPFLTLCLSYVPSFFSPASLPLYLFLWLNVSVWVLLSHTRTHTQGDVVVPQQTARAPSQLPTGFTDSSLGSTLIETMLDRNANLAMTATQAEIFLLKNFRYQFAFTWKGNSRLLDEGLCYSCFCVFVW